MVLGCAPNRVPFRNQGLMVPAAGGAPGPRWGEQHPGDGVQRPIHSLQELGTTLNGYPSLRPPGEIFYGFWLLSLTLGPVLFPALPFFRC